MFMIKKDTETKLGRGTANTHCQLKTAMMTQSWSQRRVLVHRQGVSSNSGKTVSGLTPEIQHRQIYYLFSTNYISSERVFSCTNPIQRIQKAASCPTSIYSARKLVFFVFHSFLFSNHQHENTRLFLRWDVCPV